MNRLTAMLAVGLTVAISSGATAQTVLRYNWWVPPQHAMRTEQAGPWAAEVEKATNGRVKIEFTTTSLAPPPRQYDIVRDGAADIALGVNGYTPDRFILNRVTELPFNGDNASGLSMAAWKTYDKFFKDANEYKGTVLLGLSNHGPGSIFSKKPITSLADLKGLKVRVGGGIQDQVLAALGAAVVSAPNPKSYEILERGVADASVNTPGTNRTFKVNELVKHMIKVPGGLYNSSFFVVMNEAKFKSLSPEDREAILKLSGEAWAKRAGASWDKDDVTGMEDVKAKNIEVTTVSDKVLAEIKEAAKGVEQEWLDLVAKERPGIDGKAAMAYLRQTSFGK